MSSIPTFDSAKPTFSEKIDESIHGSSEVAVEMSQVSPEEEARLRRIFDINLLPPLAFMSV